MSPTKAQQTMIYSPPLLQLAGKLIQSNVGPIRYLALLLTHRHGSASPHDSHLLATFAADSTVIRVLDVRQPGQALLELRGHAAPVNCIEWSPSRRGMLASGGDDSLVMLWDLPSANGAALNGQGDRAAASASQIGTHGIPANPTTLSAPGGGGTGSSAAGGSGNTTGGGGGISARGPTAFWRSDYEVGNLSWAPQSHLTGHGGDWLGVSGGRSIWSVKA